VGDIRSISAGSTGSLVCGSVMLTGEEKSRKEGPMVGDNSITDLHQPDKRRKSQQFCERSPANAFQNKEAGPTGTQYATFRSYDMYRSFTRFEQRRCYGWPWRFLVGAWSKLRSGISPLNPRDRSATNAAFAVPEYPMLVRHLLFASAPGIGYDTAPTILTDCANSEKEIVFRQAFHRIS
jgi:hypothetical protein